jgi:hypothetical protein
MTTTSAAEVPTWLTPGAEVASISPHRNVRVARTTVDRIGKRDVVLTNGERFPVKGLRRSEGGTWGWTVELVPASDPRVAALESEIRTSRLRGRALTALEEWRVGAGEKTDPRVPIAALAALLPDAERDRVLAAIRP